MIGRSALGQLPPPDEAPAARLCVLASSSSGNCSTLVLERGGVRRVCLIDLGLSPKRTIHALAGLGLRLDQVDDCIITHLDTDHFHVGWLDRLPGHTRLHLHERHARRLETRNAGRARIRSFDRTLALDDGASVHAMIGPHDDEGVAVLRFDLAGFGDGRLGFATDVGSLSDRLVEHLRPPASEHGLSVLAIESNYCPDLQLASARPDFLKRRIMGGSGHLSNQECAGLVRAVGLVREVVLLHLSRECNTPQAAAAMHTGAPYRVTVASPDRPTPWIDIPAAPRLAVRPSPLGAIGLRPRTTVALRETGCLFDAALVAERAT